GRRRRARGAPVRRGRATLASARRVGAARDPSAPRSGCGRGSSRHACSHGHLLTRVAEWRAMATMADLDELALALPQTTKELSDDGRPAYHVHGKLFCFHCNRRRDAVDPETGERLDDVLMFRFAGLDGKGHPLVAVGGV